MDPLKAKFLIDAAIYLVATPLVFAAGYAVSRFVHRKDVKRAVDDAHRAIENRYAAMERQNRISNQGI